MEKQKGLKLIKDFISRYGLNTDEENVVTVMHLMNNHSVDKDTAFDQCSFGANDFGIDGWYYNDQEKHLIVYQSKLSDYKGYVLKGCKDVCSAVEFLEKVMIEKELDKIPTNKAIYNLYTGLSNKIDEIKKISFYIISFLSENALLDSIEYDETERYIAGTKLFKCLVNKGGKIALRFQEYNFDPSIPIERKEYTIAKVRDTKINLRDNCHLEITYIPLYDLAILYRKRGDFLFHKNVRLSLYDYRDAKNRVVGPMENTLKDICIGKLNPNIFPFYHVGITISATFNSSNNPSEIEIQTPYIINGCQTIVIAEKFLRELENKKLDRELDIFKKVNVLAKIIIGTSEEETKVITNCNNRQNPIENWQLFSNDNIHFEIEYCLRDCGIVYERQKGKFNLLSKVEVVKDYPKTNGTYVTIEALGQLIALVRGNYQWAAKPSEIFVDKQRHDSIFTKDIPIYARDIILCSNIYKAVRTSLTNYLLIPAHNNEQTWSIFNRSIIKAYMYRIAILYFYQRYNIDCKYAIWLYKKASPNLVDDLKSVYSRFITRTKSFYLEELKNNSEVSIRKFNSFINDLFIELGIDIANGLIPFSQRCLEWKEDDFLK